MEKLTIKELAPYLPYGLKVQLSDEGRFNLDYEYPNEHKFKSGLITEFTISDGESIYGEFKVSDRYYFSFNELSEIKPLLRPLSQLTEEIEHNGERFMPYQRLYQFASNMGIHKGTFENMLNNIIEGSTHITELPYYLVKNLLEWHIDVFGLIDRGLALPIDGKEVEGCR